MNLPNRLTIARLLLVPVFVLAMSIDHVVSYVFGYIVFTAASITDYYDGKIARSRNLITNFGKLMDPLADKILVTAAFLMMMKIPGLNVPGWTIIVILAREFLVTGARSMAAADGTVIAASMTGKTKTVLQMVYIYTFLFFVIAGKGVSAWLPEYGDMYFEYLGWASMIGIVFVAGYTVYSGIDFARANWATLRLGSQSTT